MPQFYCQKYPGMPIEKLIIRKQSYLSTYIISFIHFYTITLQLNEYRCKNMLLSLNLLLFENKIMINKFYCKP